MIYLLAFYLYSPIDLAIQNAFHMRSTRPFLSWIRLLIWKMVIKELDHDKNLKMIIPTVNNIQMKFNAYMNMNMPSSTIHPS